MKRAVEQLFNGTYDAVPIGSYDATKLSYGPRCRQVNLGAGPVDKFAGPCPNAVGFAAENPLAIASAFVHPIEITDDLYWVFGNDGAAAAATRRVQMWTYVPSTGTVTYVGAITCTFPTATTHTSRGLRMLLTNVTTGTVAVSGTAVTGTGTAFATGISVGSRIGFGSTDPAAITTWYEIGATGSATSITLTASAGTIVAGTPYVIQDMMLVMTTTNTTTTNGGLFVAKGLRPEVFQQPATTIPAATTVDKIRAVYWLKDAASITNIAAGGCAVQDATSLTSQFVYVVDGASTSLKIFKYNFRAALTVASGAATLSGGDLVITGTQTVTGNISQTNNGRVATLNHGPGAGVACLYLFTTSRIARVPLASVVAASTTFVADSMAEVVPGGANTHVVVGTFVSFDVVDSLDRLVIIGAASSGTFYLAQYNTGGAQFERRFSCLTSQLNSIARDVDSPVFPHATSSTPPTVWVEGGFAFVTNNVITSNLNQWVVMPLAADWAFTATTNDRVIAPKLSLAASRLYRVLTTCAKNLGDEQLGVSPDGYRVLYRTSGIDDDSGAWTIAPENGDLSGAGAPTEIQFAFEFRTMGLPVIAARILSLALVYESVDELPSQYRWNASDLNLTNGTFAWVQQATFGGALGVHTINIYRGDTNVLVLTQASSGTTNGTFEYWNGSAWTAGLGPDVLNTRRRFVPTGSLPSGVPLYAVLTVA